MHIDKIDVEIKEHANNEQQRNYREIKNSKKLLIKVNEKNYKKQLSKSGITRKREKQQQIRLPYLNLTL